MLNQPSADQRAILEGELRERYGRVVYSHKTHEKCADILLRRLHIIKLIHIGLSAVATSGFLVGVFGENKPVAVAGLVVSLILLALNSYTKDYDLGAIAQRHRDAGSDLWLIREQYLGLLTDLKMGIEPLDSILKRREDLLPALQAIYKGAPSTNSKAYSEAQKALKISEDLTFSDAELDAFLPAELKRSKTP
jgi:hypothetical protein